MDELIADSDMTAIVKLSNAFGAHSAYVWAYAELFDITPMSKRKKRLLLILTEMKRLYDSEAFTYAKKRYEISRKGIAQALDAVVRRNFTSKLTNHNYLKSVMMNIAETEYQEKSKTEEKMLKEREDGLRQVDRLTETDIEINRARVKELLGVIK